LPRVGTQLAVDTHRLPRFEQSASVSHAGQAEGSVDEGSRVQGLSTRCAEVPQPSINAVDTTQAARARDMRPWSCHKKCGEARGGGFVRRAMAMTLALPRMSTTTRDVRVKVPAALATDDLTLVQRVRQGDQRAYKQLVERYQRKVYGIALGMVKDKEEARDVAQEAFIKVYKYLEHFKGDSSFYTWLYRITVNICIDVLRKKGSARDRDHVEFDEAVRHDTSEANIGALGSRLGTNPQKAALRKELADRINAAFSEIPEAHRKILLLREVEGMSYEDLARTLDIPKGTVMSRLFHARLKMQKILSGYLELDEAKQGVGHES